MPRITRRRLGTLVIIIAGLAILAVPFLLRQTPNPATTTKPPPAGTNPPGGGNGGGGNDGGTQDTTPPETTISITGPFKFTRANYDNYYPNFTITLHAIDDKNLAEVMLNDTGTVHQWTASGKTTNITLTISDPGVHQLTYWSKDSAGNTETPRNDIEHLSKPNISDLLNLIANSNIDSKGVKNALSTKLEHAQEEQAAGKDANSLNAFTNQVNALTDKHGLDQALADLLLTMVKMITA